MSTSPIDATSSLLTILSSLVVVPLTIITFYLRSLRDQQTTSHEELSRRLGAVESGVHDLRKTLHDFDRDYTTKEEWLREAMLARQGIDSLRETAVRLETTVRNLLDGDDRAPARLRHRPPAHSENR